MPAPTVDDLRRLQRDGEQLLRGLELELRQSLVAERDPSGVAQTWKSKLDAFARRCDDLARAPTPRQAATVIASIKSDTKDRSDDLIERAKRANDRRGQVDGKLVKAYDEAVSTGLSQLPGQAMQAGRDQLGAAIKKLVDGALPTSMVRGDQAGSFAQAKQQMATELTRWVENQDAVEDACYVAQSALLDVAAFLQRQLAIHGQIRDLKDWTADRKTLDPTAAKQVDAQAGALGKAWVQGDRQGEQSLRRATSVNTELRLDPRLVLDPSRRFLTEVNARAGITIDTGQIKIQLTGNLTITEPLMDSRKLSASQGLRVDKGPWSLTENLAASPAGRDLAVGLNYTKGNFTGGAQYDLKPGESSIKATITFRF